MTLRARILSVLNGAGVGETCSHQQHERRQQQSSVNFLGHVYSRKGAVEIRTLLTIRRGVQRVNILGPTVGILEEGSAAAMAVTAAPTGKEPGYVDVEQKNYGQDLAGMESISLVVNGPPVWSVNWNHVFITADHVQARACGRFDGPWIVAKLFDFRF